MSQEAPIKPVYARTCPACGSQMHRSRRRGFVERVLLRLLLIRPLRCHRCSTRFYCPPTFIFQARSDRLDAEAAMQSRAADAPLPSESRTKAAAAAEKR